MTEQQRGGKGNVANDPKRAAEPGKKAAQQSGSNAKSPQRETGGGQKDGQKDRR